MLLQAPSARRDSAGHGSTIAPCALVELVRAGKTSSRAAVRFLAVDARCYDVKPFSDCSSFRSSVSTSSNAGSASKNISRIAA